MEENNTQEVNETVVVETPVTEENVAEVPVEQPVTEEAVATPEVQVIDGFSSVNLEVAQPQEVVVQSEFASADTVVEAPVAEVTGTPLKPKKKVNKTLIVVLIFAVIVGGAMLLMSQGGKTNNNNGGTQEEQKEIKVNVGSDWGNKYLTYMMENKPELKTYEISFIDVNNDETPEMFLKYVDNSEKESLKILYVAEDGYVYETKYYRDYRIRFIYSLKDKTTNWYLYLTTTKQYGTYTMISKIIDDMAFDADIKATTDALLIDYGKKYYDTDYQPLFYTIKENSSEADFKEFVSRYAGYVEDIGKTKEEVENKYKDYEYKEEVKVEKDTIGISGRIYKLGIYYTYLPVNEDAGRLEEEIRVLILNNDGTISVDGKLYEYTIDYENSLIYIYDNTYITLGSGTFNYLGNEYVHSSVFVKPE